MGVSLTRGEPDDDEDESAPGSGQWALVWDPEEGPVWGKVGDLEKEKQEDKWSQLLRDGVSGITTDNDGEEVNGLGTCWNLCSHFKYE